jgi:hypothetical protein
MLFQNALTPLTLSTTATSAVVATVRANGIEIGKLTAFPLNGVLTYYLDSLLPKLKIQEDTPDFISPYRITKPNIPIQIEVDGKTINEVLYCGITHPTTGKLTNNFKRSAADSPYQVTYIVKEAVFARLYGSVNGGEYVELTLIKILDVQDLGAYLTLNLHQYYGKLNATDYDVVHFKFDKLPFTETIRLDATYTDFPFHLAMRNDYGFFDCFRFFGGQEITYDYQNNNMESLNAQRTVYNESTEKISLQTGLLEQNEKQIIAQNLQNLDFFEYRNGQPLRLISENKAAPKFSTREYQDNLKLEFRYATITRRYQ